MVSTGRGVCVSAVVALCAISGCNANYAAAPAARTDRVPARSVVTLQHDFGLLRPHAGASHEFAIANPSDTVWTIRQVHSGCGCAVASLSTDRITPGSTAIAKVTYRAPKEQNAEERRTVTIQFAEASAPHVRLVVEANIRAPLVAVPEALRFEASECQRESPLCAVINVSNFTNERWPSIDSSPSTTWLRSEAQLVDVAAEDHPVQAILRPSSPFGSRRGIACLTRSAQRCAVSTVTVGSSL